MLKDRVLAAIARAGLTVKFDRLEVVHLDEPHRVDPLNLRSILTCIAVVGGEERAWRVEAPRERRESEELLNLLIEGLVSEIRSHPDQTLSSGSIPTASIGG